MSTLTVESPKTLTFAKSQHELVLSLESTGVLFQSSFKNLLIQSSQSLTIDQQTVTNSNLVGLGAFIGVWKGTSMITSDLEFIGYTNLTEPISDGKFHNNTITLDKPGNDLITDTVTIGLFLRNNDITSLAASVTSFAQKPVNYQGSSIFISNITTRNIQVNYTVPSFINPKDRLDWILLFKGTQPEINNNNYIKNASVGSNESSGIVNMDVSDILFTPGDYIMQYNPGYSVQTIASAYSFVIQ